MSQITATITADFTLVSHLLDTCTSLVAACRELQKASRPAQLVDHDIDVPEPISRNQSRADRSAEADEKYRHVDMLIDHILEAPDEWHSSVLDDWMRTEAGYHRVVTRLHKLGKKRGIKISVVRKLDEDDPGNSVHVHLRQGGEL